MLSVIKTLNKQEILMVEKWKKGEKQSKSIQQCAVVSVCSKDRFN